MIEDPLRDTPTLQRTLLAVFAHPDDESFGPGGTLAFYAEQGVEVHLICATRGEVGETPDGSGARSEGDVASMRENELLCAAEFLGLEKVHFLDYRDSGMPGAETNYHPRALTSAPQKQVAEKVAAIIKQVQPQVVITFDPIGGYRHPDHIAIHEATLDAFHSLLEAQEPGFAPPQKLYYHSFPKRTLRMLVKLMPLFGQNPREFGMNKDIDLVDIAEVEYPINAAIQIRSVMERKAKASACHASQQGGSSGGIFGMFMRLLGGKELFMRAHPPAPESLRETDLFDGVD